MIYFVKNNPQKFFVSNMDIEFDGTIGANFLEHYKAVLHLENLQLITNKKTIPLH